VKETLGTIEILVGIFIHVDKEICFTRWAKLGFSILSTILQ